MLYRHHRPGPPLGDFVELLWYYERPASAHALERVLPTATLEIVVDLGGDGMRLHDRRDLRRFDSYAGALVCGPHAQFFVIDTARRCALMGVHFRPGGAAPFFAVPLDEVSNAHVTLDAVWGEGSAELRERLLAAPSVAAKFRCLETLLLHRLAAAAASRAALRAALARLRAAPQVAIGELAEEIGLTQRRLIRLFRDQVGLTPKAFGRVRRFQRALRSIGAAADVDWTETALACGYYDQAHFIHDFRDFCGLTPGAYLARRGEHMNHVPQEG